MASTHRTFDIFRAANAMACNRSASDAPPRRRSERIEKLAKVKEDRRAATPLSRTKRLRRPRQRKSCHLLSLPGELRNRIYELAIVQDDPVCITSKGPGEPALLRACRQIRREAGTLYYGSNEFELHLRGFNGADFVPFARQRSRLATFGKTQDVSFVFDRRHDWDNLVAWIKAIWTDIALEPEWSEPRFRDRQIASSAFKLARTCGHWGWEKKAKALEVMYEALRGTDSSWVKDEDYLLW